MNIHLCGVHHCLQVEEPGHCEDYYKLLLKFEEFLKAESQDRGISLVAEEYNEEAVRLQALISKGLPKTTCQSVASQLDVAHLFIDPNSLERKTLGIVGDHLAREEEWLQRLLASKHVNILAVVGDSHFNSFSQLLKGNGHAVFKVVRQAGMSEEDKLNQKMFVRPKN